jgi:hypothetical protein
MCDVIFLLGFDSRRSRLPLCTFLVSSRLASSGFLAGVAVPFGSSPAARYNVAVRMRELICRVCNEAFMRPLGDPCLTPWCFPSVRGLRG